MQLLNLNIDQIIIHQIFQRDQDSNKIEPIQSHEFTRFDNTAMEAFKVRVKDALGEGSKAVQMKIVDQGASDLAHLVNKMVDQEEVDFAVSSYDIAKNLTNAQQRKSLSGGIVVVFTGTQGYPPKKFLGIIKAEVHSGYEKNLNINNEISLKFIEEVLLTPSSRLYKTAGFFEKPNSNPSSSDLNDVWKVMVSDTQISKADGKAAAQYFYSDFLGCGYPDTSARTTKQFYDATGDFITCLDTSESIKNDFLNALTTYLKVDTSSTISSSEFASKYFNDVDLQDAFTSHMKESGLPTSAFTKDIEHIESKLQFRKIRFSGNLKITGPSKAFRELVTIEAIDGDPDESGEPTAWTKIIIKDKIANQE